MRTGAGERPLIQAKSRSTDGATHRGIGRPPFPREHGAWVILYCPLLLGFGAAAVVAPLRWLLLTVAVTGAFLAREAAGLLLRRRGKAGAATWLSAYMALFLMGALPLLVVYHLFSLLVIGVLAGILFGIHSLLLRGRLDRSQWGEILGVGALTLTAPAAYAVATGRLDSHAWLLWAACILYFSSAIFTVKMFLSAAKAKRDWNVTKRRAIGRDTLQYHLLLTVALALAAMRIGGTASVWLIAAYLPALVRALRARATLTPNLPPLKWVGIQEAVLTLWFIGCMLAAVRGWHLR